MKTIQLIVCSLVLLPVAALAQEGRYHKWTEEYYNQENGVSGESRSKDPRQEMNQYVGGKDCDLESGYESDAPVIRTGTPANTSDSSDEDGFTSIYQLDGMNYSVKIRPYQSFEIYEMGRPGEAEWTEEQIQAFDKFRREHNNMTVEEFTQTYTIESVQLIGK